MKALTYCGLDILGDVTELPAIIKKDPIDRPPLASLKSLFAGMIGSAAGYFVYRKSHPVLGAIGGFSFGSNGYDLVSGDRSRFDALLRAARTAAGIAGAAVLPIPKPLGFVAGSLAGYGLSTIVERG